MSNKNKGPLLTSKVVGSNRLIPEKFQRQVTVTETKQAVPLDVEVGSLGSDEVQRTLIQNNTDERVLTVTKEVVNLNAEALQGQQTGTWGVEGVEEKLVPEGTATQTGFGIKESRVVPLGNGQAVSEKSTWDTSTVLRETVVDDQTGLVIEVEKKLVPAGTVGSFSSGQVVEVQPIDKWHSVQITSKLAINGLPDTEIIGKSVRYSFEDQLLALNLVFAGGTFFGSNASWIDTVAAIMPVIKHGPSGTFNGYVERSFYTSLPAYTPGVWFAYPEPVSAICVYSAFGLDGNGNIGSRETSVSVGPTLHGQLGITQTPHTYQVYFKTNLDSSTVPATNPASLPESGDPVLISSNVEKWRLGIYVKEDTYVIMP